MALVEGQALDLGLQKLERASTRKNKKGLHSKAFSVAAPVTLGTLHIRKYKLFLNCPKLNAVNLPTQIFVFTHPYVINSLS